MRIASSSEPQLPGQEDRIPMRSGRLPATPALLRTGLRASALALAALLLSGAAPAGAVSSVCESVVDVGIVCFDQDLGTGTDSSDDAQSMFLAMLVNPGTENFSSFETGETDLVKLSFGSSGVMGWLTDGVEEGGSISDLDDPERGFPISTDQFWKNETTDGEAGELFIVNFDTAVRAFGFYATAWSTQSTADATALELELIPYGGGTSTFVPIEHSQLGELEGSVFYVGVIADLPFIAAVLRNNTGCDPDECEPGDRIGFDDFTVAVVPEPSTGLLLSAGLLGLAAIGRRRVA
jgi:hypothetical protein